MTASGRKLTRNQQAVLACLSGAGRAMTAYEILDDVRPAGIRAPVQVYRALESLIGRGAIHRIESENAFVACTHDHGDGVADREGDHDQAAAGAGGAGVVFAICDGCGQVIEIPLADETARLTHIAQRNGFFMDRAVMEIRGLCTPCRADRQGMSKSHKTG